METAGVRGGSRKQKGKNRNRKDRKISHFQSVRFGGFEETQVICYLWDLAKAMDLFQQDEQSGMKKLTGLEKEMRSRVRVEMRRYFLRHKRRNTLLVFGGITFMACVMLLFTQLIGVDRVFGNSMYPYLNNGDWVVYSRIGKKIQRDEVIVFEKQGESLVKRVAGLSGDTVEISASGNCVAVNGILVSEAYGIRLDSETDAERKEREEPLETPQTVLDGHYLVLGDNREVSVDSRDKKIGMVAEDEILGRVVLIVRLKE